MGGAGEEEEERRAAREALEERFASLVERVRALHLEVYGADMPAGGGTSFNALTVNNCFGPAQACPAPAPGTAASAITVAQVYPPNSTVQQGSTTPSQNLDPGKFMLR